MQGFDYVVSDRDGRVVLQAPLSCRYDKETERSLLASGYTIKADGKKISTGGKVRTKPNEKM